MISKQKARRIACGILYEAMEGLPVPVGDEWTEDEKQMIHVEIARIRADLYKKSQ